MANLSLSEINYQKIQDLEYRLEKLKAEVVLNTETNYAQEKTTSDIKNNYALRNSSNLNDSNKKSWKNVVLNKTILWNGQKSTTGDITLNESIRNFTNLYFYYRTLTKENIIFGMIPVTEFLETSSANFFHLPLHNPDIYKWINLYYVSDTVMSIAGTDKCELLKIYGE